MMFCLACNTRDWYNLEKSKRVKAFRCGVFDDCIERAEAAQGMPPKKREKYARREDAILHALELERQLMEKKYGKSGNSSNGRRKSPDAVTSSERLGNGAGNQIDPRSDQLPEMLGLAVVEKNGTDQHLCEETVKDVNQPSGDDDSAGALPRMRGLQDLGLRTTPPMSKLLPSAFSNILNYVLVNSTLVLFNKLLIVLFWVRSGEEHSGVAISRVKRSRNAYLTYDSGDCSNDNQNLTTQMEIPVSKFDESSYQADAGEDHISGSTEDTETDCSETDSVESDSDEDMAPLSGLPGDSADGAGSIELQPKYPRSIETHEDHGSISSSDDFDEMAYADGLPHHLPHGYISSSVEVSKWRLKGKRNNRNIGKKYPDRTDAELPKGYANSRNSNWSSGGGFKADPIDKSLRNHASSYGSTGLHSSHETADLDGFAWNNQSITRGYWEDSQEYVDPFFVGRHPFGGRAMLIDVDLEVQANNYRRDVPMISLMSKLNGHAIIGHPIQIEALESDLSENHVSTTDYFHPEPLETPALPSVWRTGRRTANSRVPRPFLNGESKQHALFIDQGTRLKGSVTQRSFPQYPIDRKFSRNSPKKSSPSANQKIRSLSSIASDEQHQSDPRNDTSCFQVGGMIKTGNLPTTVACIPVNLVFSRLHEELVGRHQ
ncbi:hypothetical protein SASPL_106693 [Salvia splendens]|uniref:Uncharacterized protein n=1 Tax=Salvia splendens TaxID=180675 RepID=A0A8X9ACS0_SALSN|nr:hypothetical protein SASPL_106693 [Salvia splendens]